MHEFQGCRKRCTPAAPPTALWIPGPAPPTVRAAPATEGRKRWVEPSGVRASPAPPTPRGPSAPAPPTARTALALEGRRGWVEPSGCTRSPAPPIPQGVSAPAPPTARAAGARGAGSVGGTQEGARFRLRLRRSGFGFPPGAQQPHSLSGRLREPWPLAAYHGPAAGAAGPGGQGGRPGPASPHLASERHRPLRPAALVPASAPAGARLQAAEHGQRGRQWPPGKPPHP